MADDNDTPVKDTVTNPESTNPAPEGPPPVAEPETPRDDLRDVVGTLVERVGILEGMVTAVVQTGDSTPQTKPWTHRNPFRRGDR